MTSHPTASREEWLAARRELWRKERELTRVRDELARERRALPWVKVGKPYLFDGPGGSRTLADLFDGRSQHVVYHFMLAPGWKEGCVGCSFLADHIDAARLHLEHHDVTVAAVSRAPFAEIDAFKRRMGWRFPWVSSYGGDFNYDFHVSFPRADVEKGHAYDNYAVRPLPMEDLSGTSVFTKDADGTVFHTCSAYARGDVQPIGAYHFPDLTPTGRNETGPNHDLSDRVRHHDRYDAAGRVDATGRCVAAAEPRRHEGATRG